MGFRGIGFVAVAALVAGPALAERAFIPVAAGPAGHGATHRTEISLTNAKGARAQTVLASLGREAGGASAQKVALGGGQTRRLSGLAGNGLLELDLAKGVEAEATLVVERPGRKSQRIGVPVLTQVDHMPAGTRAVFLGAEVEDDHRPISVGAINLSSRAMRCSASFEDANGKQLFAPASFTVAPYSERRSGSFAGGKGRADVASLAAVRCDQPFWAYSVNEQASTGDVKFLYPAKEVVLTASTSASKSSVTTQLSIFYQIPGQFFVAGPGKWAYRYTMYFFPSKTIRKIFTDFDVYHAGWDPAKPGGIHLVMWMQERGWATLLGYYNTMKKGVNKYRWNKAPNGNVGQSSPGIKPGSTYHVKTWWDGERHRSGFRAERGGVLYDTKENVLGLSQTTTAKLFVVFAHERNTLRLGPESRSPGWRWSNLDIELVSP